VFHRGEFGISVRNAKALRHKLTTHETNTREQGLRDLVLASTLDPCVTRHQLHCLAVAQNCHDPQEIRGRASAGPGIANSK